MRKLVPLKSIYAFVAVAETGSMTDAARTLNVSHSAISQSVKSLESLINKPLFHRVGRKVELNSAGKKYYKQVAPALELIVDATESMISQPQDNRITLNMVNSLALHWWIPRVQSLQDFAPQLDVRLSNLVGSFNLNQEGVDVALIHGKTEEWQDYYCEKLSDDELVMVCSPELLKSLPSATPSELMSKYPAILVANARRKEDWQIWCDATHNKLPTYRNNLTFNASVQAVHATIRKLGVLVTHRLFVRDDIKHGLLTEIEKPVPNPKQDFYFTCAPEKLKHESVLTLRSWLREEFTR